MPALIFLLVCSTATTVAQTYSSDFFTDFEMPAYCKITPIGDIGDIETIIDLRGFIPLAGVSKAKRKHQGASVFNWFTDNHQWYQLDTVSAIAILYYPKIDDKTAQKKFARTKLLREDALRAENLQWAKFAYALASKSGKELFKAAGGSKGLDTSEPVAVLLTARSAIVLLSFKYSDGDREGTGQVLCAFEFSRTLKEYRTFYALYDTFAFSRSTKNAFKESLPYVTKALSLYFTLNQ